MWHTRHWYAQVRIRWRSLIELGIWHAPLPIQDKAEIGEVRIPCTPDHHSDQTNVLENTDVIQANRIFSENALLIVCKRKYLWVHIVCKMNTLNRDTAHLHR